MIEYQIIFPLVIVSIIGLVIVITAITNISYYFIEKKKTINN
jgi:uncharacterized membrane protein